MNNFIVCLPSLLTRIHYMYYVHQHRHYNIHHRLPQALTSLQHHSITTETTITITTTQISPKQTLSLITTKPTTITILTNHKYHHRHRTNHKNHKLYSVAQFLFPLEGKCGPLSLPRFDLQHFRLRNLWNFPPFVCNPFSWSFPILVKKRLISLSLY